jgi:hypothetical protein
VRAPGAFSVQSRVDLREPRVARMQRTPGRKELLRDAAPALVARPVARCASGRLIEEEELGVAPGLHQRMAPTPLELEQAGDPALDLPAPDEVAVCAHETAAVPHHGASGRVGFEHAERRDAVLEGHIDAGRTDCSAPKRPPGINITLPSAAAEVGSIGSAAPATISLPRLTTQ